MDAQPHSKPIPARARQALRALREWLLTVLPPRLARAWRHLLPRRQSRTGPAGGKQILILRLDNLGDVLMSTPIFRELRRYDPMARITVAVRAASRPLLERNPNVDSILCLEHGSLAGPLDRLMAALRFYWRHLRGRRFDVVLHPRTGNDYLHESLLLALLDAPVSIGFCARPGSHGLDRSQVLTRALPPPGPKSEVLANADVLSALIGRPIQPELELVVDEEDLRAADRLLAPLAGEALLVGLGVGASARKRQWSAALWAETLRLLSQQRMAAVIFATPEDAALARALMDELNGLLPVQVIVGAPLRHIAACISRCRLFLGTDSALAHIAAAMQTPVVVVSPHPVGGDPEHDNSPERFAPFARQVRVVRPGHPRPPCTSACEMPEAHCILEIAPNEVAQAAAELLPQADFSTTRSQEPS